MSRIAFMFPGQGAQGVGMGKSCDESVPAAARLFDAAGEVLGYDLRKLCQEGPAEELDTTARSQPALYVCSLAAVEMLRQDQPDVVLSCEAACGLSLGEYTALVFAGAMDFETGLRLVQARGEAMQAASNARPSGMVSILGLEVSQVEEICSQAADDQLLVIANHLCPGNLVVSGDNGACERAAALALDAGAMKVVPLAVAGAFHTEIMAPAVERLRGALADAKMQKPTIPVYSNVDAAPHDDPAEIRELLVRQVSRPVLWEASLRRMLDDGFDRFYEVGPGRVLRGLLRRVSRSTFCDGVVC